MIVFSSNESVKSHILSRGTYLYSLEHAVLFYTNISLFTNHLTKNWVILSETHPQRGQVCVCDQTNVRLVLGDCEFTGYDLSEGFFQLEVWAANITWGVHNKGEIQGDRAVLEGD